MQVKSKTLVDHLLVDFNKNDYKVYGDAKPLLIDLEYWHIERIIWKV